MRKNSKVILIAEEQLVFGKSLPEMIIARDNLRTVLAGLPPAGTAGRPFSPTATEIPNLEPVGSVTAWLRDAWRHVCPPSPVREYGREAQTIKVAA